MSKLLSYSSLVELYKQKHNSLLSEFADLQDPNKIYETILRLGKALKPSHPSIQSPDNLVAGCQSEVYLASRLTDDGKVYFDVHSEALISSGLAGLLLSIYNLEPPELILVCPPVFISDLGLSKNLSPGRSNGIASMFAKMKQNASSLLAKV